jgi:hypothetical protein
VPKTSQFGNFRNVERISGHVMRERKGKKSRKKKGGGEK